MKKAIIHVNPLEYGLTETKAQEIEQMFSPMLQRMTELEKEYNEVIKLEMSKEACQKARELRLQYVKVRTGTDVIHKKLKSFYLNGGRFVDGWKNAQLMASQGNEEKLKDIENYYKKIEEEKIAKLQTEREGELLIYHVEEIPPGLGNMDLAVWNNLLAGAKASWKAILGAEKKAEEDRIAKEKAEKEEAERIRKENEQLRKEAEEREKAEAIRIEKERKEREIREAQERKEIEERLAKEKKERDAYEAKIRKAQEEKDEAERKLRVEREEKERLQRLEEEKVALEETKRKKAERDALLAPDKEKLEQLAKTIQEVELPTVESDEALGVLVKVTELLNKTGEYILKNAQSL